MGIKVSDLAKELGVKNDEVLDQLRRLYMDAEDGNSQIGDKIAALVRIKLGGSSVPEKPKKEKKPKKAVVKKKTTEPAEEEKKPAKKTKGRKKKEETPEKEPEAVAPGKEEEKVDEAPKKDTITIDVPGKRAIEIVERAPVSVPEEEKAPEVSNEEEEDKDLLGKKKKKVSKEKPAIEIVEKAHIPKSYTKKGKQKGKKHNIEIIEKAAIGQRPRRPASLEEVRLSAGKAEETKQASARKAPQKLEVHFPVSVRTLAPRINIKPNQVLQYLMAKGAFTNINQDLDEETVRDILANFGYDLELGETVESIEKDLVGEQQENLKANLVSRAPVVTFMGHVDHGKTSLLDYIRKTMVAKDEKGGITQHIGAYKVETSKGAVTFLDTPGHAAFTAMRARGAHATDVVVLVVAADDGVMPQTKEAIDHARAANVPIVVAINKCDLPGAQPDKVKQELQKEGLAPEVWGGSTIMVEVSAHTGQGVDSLVEMLMLESEMLELKANPTLRARGVVIESRKTPGQGVVVTLLVQNGTLKPGDIVLCGSNYGKVKAMLNNSSKRVEEALPSTPVEVLGLQGLPEAGEEFFAVKDEKKAKTLTDLKKSQSHKKKIFGRHRVTLEDLHTQIMEGEVKELKIVLKADVQGSMEALEHSFGELATSEVKLNIIHSAVGNVNESDVMLAVVSNAIIIGFHVKIDGKAEEMAKSENIDYRMYEVIYEAIADVRAGMEGLLEPEEKEVYQGAAQVKQMFQATKIGKVAGCSVIKGVIHRKDMVRVKRADEIIHTGEIDALKRFKDDVKEVKEGFECGISLKGFTDIRVNDIIEAYIVEKVARRLTK
ncbi:MAG: translation initiation factor IF-2 [Candidatus Omnitrophica bacterium]|nr:translation initiation factor IF-2 [Candidatus Omnitrophota bacterium]MDD5487578.1 translation initiation factor IF-2 [Candidatus Omnitrophota bacterium]